MFDVLVFDWDGTLVDSTGLIARAILQAAEDIGVPVPDRGKASHVIGLGLAQALAQVVPDLPQERISEFAARYHVHFRAGEEAIQLFPGAAATLAELRRRGFRLAVATGKTDRGLRRAMESAGLTGLFESTRCADQTHPKPHPAMLLELSDDMNVRCGRMLMIGDTSHDLEMARAAGVAAVGVSFGAHRREHLARFEPLMIHDTPEALHAWLLALSRDASV